MTSPSDAPPESGSSANPLDRLTRGGWKKGLLRLSIGAALVGLVLYFSGGDALAQLAHPQLLGIVLVGALFHVAQRAARIAKWHRLIQQAPLRPRSLRYLLRIQFVGMLANLLLPVSEALKVWAVSRNRREAVIASESIVVDTALHAGFIGAAGVIGAASVWSAQLTVWLAAIGMTVAALLLVVALRYWPRRGVRGYQINLPALLWCVLETAGQLALYLLALRAVGLHIGALEVLAYSPMLFLADLVMLTPSGVGLREALFATVLAAHTDMAADTSVAVGLLVSSMLLLATLLGGGIALALPSAVPPSSSGPQRDP